MIAEDIGKILGKYKDTICVTFKVELVDAKFNTLMLVLLNLLDKSRKQDHNLLDLDVTQDFCRNV